MLEIAYQIILVSLLFIALFFLIDSIVTSWVKRREARLTDRAHKRIDLRI